MATTADAAETFISLTEDVYGDLADFRETAYMAIDTLDSDSGSQIYASAVEVIIGAIGYDPVKAYALIDVVHDKIITQRSWATVIAIKFYE